MPNEVTVLEYYNLKHRYDLSIRKIVEKTLRDTGNKRHKILKFDALIKNVQCPQCKKTDPVRFESTANQLKIRCPHKKCKINNMY